MKNIKGLARGAAAALLAGFLAAPAFAGGFGLNGLRAGDLRGGGADLPAAPVPAPAYAADAGQDLDMSVTIPFAELNERMGSLSERMKVLDASAPVLARRGDRLVFSNVGVDYNGIEIDPVVEFRPRFEGENRLVIEFLSADMQVAFGPKSIGGFDKEELAATVVDSLASGISQAMDAAFAANKVRARSAEVLSFRYDKAAWRLDASVTPGFVAPLLPGLLDELRLTSFEFDDAGFTLAVRSGGAERRQPGYNLALSDGLFTRLMARCAAGTSFDLAPEGHPGGIAFLPGGRVTVSGKTAVSGVPLKPSAYFTALLSARLTGPNTLAVKFERLTVTQASVVPLPEFVAEWLQETAIKSTIGSLTGDADLARVLDARRLDERTVEIRLKPAAFLPSFAGGTEVKAMKLTRGRMHLALGF